MLFAGARGGRKELGNEEQVIRGRIRMLLETAFHVLDEGDGVEEFALALRTLLNPAFVLVLLALLDAVDIVLQAGNDFGPVSVAGELSLTSPAVDPAVKLGVVDDGQEDGVGHPLGLLGQHGPLVRGSTGVLVDSQGLLVQELEAAHLTLFDLTFGSVLGTVIDTVDVVGGSGDLLEPFGCVVAGECLVASLAVDVEREVFDHVRLEGNVCQAGDPFPLIMTTFLMMVMSVVMAMVMML